MKIKFIIIFLLTFIWSAFFKMAFDHRPAIVDESSYIFQAQTFLEGRLSNPSPINPQFFENQSLIIEPTFSSQYPPLTSLILALSEFIFSEMLWGNILTHALTASFIFLMLSLYVKNNSAILMALLYGFWPPYAFEWAGTYRSADIVVLAVTFILMSYRDYQKIYSPIALATGLAILILARPFEGFFISIPFVVYFLIKNKKTFRIQHFISLVIFSVGLGLQLSHNKSTTNNWTEHPRSLVVTQYFYSPMLNFIGNKDLNKHITEHERLKKYYIDYELKLYESQETFSGFINTLKHKILKNIKFHLTYYLLPLLILGLYLLRKFKTIFLSLLFFSFGFLFIIADLTIYTACLVPIGFLAMGKAIDLPLFQKIYLRPIVYITFALGFYSTFLMETNYMTGRNNRSVYYKEEFSTSLTNSFNGKKLVAFVSYSKDHDLHNEWIYNHPNLDKQSIIWVWDSGIEKNSRFMKNYNDRDPVCLFLDNSMPIKKLKPCVLNDSFGK